MLSFGFWCQSPENRRTLSFINLMELNVHSMWIDLINKNITVDKVNNLVFAVFSDNETNN